MSMHSTALDARELRTTSLSRSLLRAMPATSIRQWFTRIRAEQRLRRDIESLKILDDHTLADIGLDRRTLECDARCGRLSRRKFPGHWP